MTITITMKDVISFGLDWAMCSAAFAFGFWYGKGRK